MNIDLSTDTPPSPERTLRLTGALPELVRALNHATADHEALQSPAEADRVLGDITTAVSFLGQSLAQLGAWLDRERQAGRIAVVGAGNPDQAVVAARVNLDWARTILAEAVTALKAATAVTATLAGREDETDGS